MLHVQRGGRERESERERDPVSALVLFFFFKENYCFLSSLGGNKNKHTQNWQPMAEPLSSSLQGWEDAMLSISPGSRKERERILPTHQFESWLFSFEWWSTHTHTYTPFGTESLKSQLCSIVVQCLILNTPHPDHALVWVTHNILDLKFHCVLYHMECKHKMSSLNILKWPQRPIL